MECPRYLERRREGPRSRQLSHQLQPISLSSRYTCKFNLQFWRRRIGSINSLLAPGPLGATDHHQATSPSPLHQKCHYTRYLVCIIRAPDAGLPNYISSPHLQVIKHHPHFRTKTDHITVLQTHKDFDHFEPYTSSSTVNRSGHPN